MKYGKHFVWLLLIILLTPSAAEAFFNLNLSGLGACGASGISSSCTGSQDKLFASIACKVMSMIDRAVIPLYCSIIYNPAYSNAVNAAMVLYVVIAGISYTFGLSRVSVGDLSVRLIKVSLVYALVSNASFFFSFIYTNVMQTPQQLVLAVLNATGSGSSNFFEHLDKSMYKIFTEVFGSNLPAKEQSNQMVSTMKIATFAIVLKEMVPGGNSLAAIFMFVVGMWLVSYLQIAIRYLFAYLGIVFLLMLAPIFIPCFLFKSLKYMWEEWIKMMLTWIIEIILVVAFLLLVENFYTDFYDLLKKAFNSSNITTEQTTYLKPYNDKSGKLVVAEEMYQRQTKGLDQFVSSLGYGSNTDAVAEIWVQIITMGLVVFLAVNFLGYITTLAQTLTGGYTYLKVMGGDGQNTRNSGSRNELFSTGQRNNAENENARRDSASGGDSARENQ
jgi:type IV secretory pathway VirB6-like protein